MEVHNEDARDFLRATTNPDAVVALLQKRTESGDSATATEAPATATGDAKSCPEEEHGKQLQKPVEVHIIMNLPELAVEFLGSSREPTPYEQNIAKKCH